MPEILHHPKYLNYVSQKLSASSNKLEKHQAFKIYMHIYFF